VSRPRRLYEETREAPPGYVWRAEPSVHELVASEWTDDASGKRIPGAAAAAKRDLLERVALGVEPCTEPECDWCAETGGALSSLEVSTLLRLAERGRRSRPECVEIDAPELVDRGLVVFVKETASGTTHFRCTERGLEVAALLSAELARERKRRP
jgi:hypothetical protein